MRLEEGSYRRGIFRLLDTEVLTILETLVVSNAPSDSSRAIGRRLKKGKPTAQSTTTAKYYAFGILCRRIAQIVLLLREFRIRGKPANRLSTLDRKEEQ